MRYAVTGATGFIGRRVAAQLRAAGHGVTALVREPARAADLAALGVELAQGDILDRPSVRRAMEGADGLFHLAAWYKIGARSRGEAEAVNVEGTRIVLESMREAGVPKGVYTSTVAVFSDTRGKMADESYRFEGRHLSAYDRTKWRAHYEVALPMAEAGLPLVIVQPGVVYGPGDTSEVGKAFRQYLAGRLPMLPKGAEYCWSHVDDVAAGHLQAMEKGRAGDSYILAGPRHSLVEAFQIAEKVTGVKAPRLTAPPALLKALSLVMAPVGAVLPLPQSYTSEALRVAAGATYLGDDAKARRELGYAPRALEEGLRETLRTLMVQAD